MKDVAIALDHRPGALADLGETLGRAGISVEGGGVFAFDEAAVAHFLFAADAPTARVLAEAGFRVLAEREVVIVRLRQSEPGQLGKIARRMADAGVNIEVQYSDHDHQLILVVDDLERARAVAAAWTAGSGARHDGQG
ncbi:MAG: amino acid-binding ACT domain-containing protein [Acidobacteria bacterium]|nr:amino acid-binding ACT domain-containing protein [Acidobacteriota bacterium]